MNTITEAENPYESDYEYEKDTEEIIAKLGPPYLRNMDQIMQQLRTTVLHETQRMSKDPDGFTEDEEDMLYVARHSIPLCHSTHMIGILEGFYKVCGLPFSVLYPSC